MYSDLSRRSVVTIYALSEHGAIQRDDWQVRIHRVVKNDLARKINEAKHIARGVNLLNRNMGITYVR